MLDAHPGAAVSAFVVWVPMLAPDSVEAAQAVAYLVRDERASHFYDGGRRIARAIAATVGGVRNIAWDCYLFYAPGARWEDVPPPPERWMHQLGPGTWADPARFRWADALTLELGAAAAELLS